VLGHSPLSSAPISALADDAPGAVGVLAATYSPVADIFGTQVVLGTLTTSYSPVCEISGKHGISATIAASYVPAVDIVATHSNLLTELPAALDSYYAPVAVTVVDSGDYYADVEVEVEYPSGDYYASVSVAVVDSGDYYAPVVVAVLGSSARWTDQVLLGGVDVSSRLTGQVRDEQYEGAAHTAEFTLVPVDGVIDPYSYVGASVVIDYVRRETTGNIPLRRFTGVVRTPEYNPVDRTITFLCTDDLQNNINALPRAVLDAFIGGRYVEAVQGEADNNWDYAQALMETVAGSLDGGRHGGLRVTPWDGLPVWKTFDLTNTFDGSIGQELPQRSNIINRIDYTFEYRFTRLHRRTTSLRYQGDMEVIASNALPLLTRATVEAALQATGWEFFYGDGFGGNSAPGVGSSVFGLSGGQPATPQIHWIPYPEEYTLPGGGTWIQRETDTTCLGFQCGMYKRWAQSVTETYALTVIAPESVTQNGEIAREDRGALASEWDASAWEQDRRAAPVLNSSSWSQTQDYAPDATTADRDYAMQAAVDLCTVKILGSHRSGRAWATVPLDTDIDVSRAIRINSPKVSATGKVVRVVNITDKDAGSATTEFHIAPSGHGAIGLPEVVATPNTPPAAPTPTAPTQAVRNAFGLGLSLHVGAIVSSALPESEEWQGWIVNVQPSFNVTDPDALTINPKTQQAEVGTDPYSGNVTNPLYVAANAYQHTGFRVILPAIEDEARDNIVPTVQKTYEIPIPADEFALAA
jgi:hypothetical protein